ncbi:hypothetical protein SLOPH_2225 [Spraguea lophii 42_110]|uniref:Uncharacterized protein n=1 Tax=Spraguea lophii (strain 42_110) TaxID=1358809 RepID=S7XTY2_SPRLO|nr:hypothetical protein SLOPH_2225 [Spraguea lophii 42_110]
MLVNEKTPEFILQKVLGNFCIDKKALGQALDKSNIDFIYLYISEVATKNRNIIILTQSLLDEINKNMKVKIPKLNIDVLFSDVLKCFFISRNCDVINNVNFSNTAKIQAMEIFASDNKNMENVIKNITSDDNYEFQSENTLNKDVVPDYYICKRNNKPVFEFFYSLIKSYTNLKEETNEYKILIEKCKTIEHIYDEYLYTLETFFTKFQSKNKTMNLSFLRSTVNFYCNINECYLNFLSDESEYNKRNVININFKCDRRGKGWFIVSKEAVYTSFGLLFLLQKLLFFSNISLNDFKYHFQFIIIVLASVFYFSTEKTLKTINNTNNNLFKSVLRNICNSNYYRNFMYIISVGMIFLLLVDKFSNISKAFIPYSIISVIASSMPFLAQTFNNIISFFYVRHYKDCMIYLYRKVIYVLLYDVYLLQILIFFKDIILFFYCINFNGKKTFKCIFISILYFIKLFQIIDKIKRRGMCRMFIIEIIKLLLTISYGITKNIMGKKSIGLSLAACYETGCFLWEVLVEMRLNREIKIFYNIFYVIALAMSLSYHFLKYLRMYYMDNMSYVWVNVLGTIYKIYFWSVFYNENSYIEYLQRINDEKNIMIEE